MVTMQARQCRPGKANGVDMTTSPWTKTKPTAVLVFADGTVIEGQGVGATGQAQAEVCFNTALTGYQEILTDPSYMGQIVTFTFPHIGNIGANDEDIEDLTPAARIGASARLQGRHHRSVQLPFGRGISTHGSRRAASSACRASTPAP
jgi:hypothetical protein